MALLLSFPLLLPMSLLHKLRAYGVARRWKHGERYIHLGIHSALLWPECCLPSTYTRAASLPTDRYYSTAFIAANYVLTIDSDTDGAGSTDETTASARAEDYVLVTASSVARRSTTATYIIEWWTSANGRHFPTGMWAISSCIMTYIKNEPISPNKSNEVDWYRKTQNSSSSMKWRIYPITL